jgi:NADH-quinone oxidoreductase subunit L
VTTDTTAAVHTVSYLWLIPALPLAGFLACVATQSRRVATVVAPGVVGASFIVTLIAVAALLAEPAGARLVDPVYTWIAAGPFRADVAFRIDALSAVMTFIVTGVGFLIHVYSVGYMAHDESQPRFFAYLNLFMFSMLLLVLGDNVLLLFVGWEGVGLCSYLLIGFWFEDENNAAAGKKAFIVNRIGDVGFVLGVLLLAWSTATPDRISLDFAHINAAAPDLAPTVATAIALLLLVGATGKSAQIPLYVWLPDAMAGPTPVSALIHAATMVTAGIYMIARLNPIFVTATPVALDVVAVVGAVTAIFAATIALVQTDIKKVLAYSTVSQLGYMFLALGVGAFATAIFHVFTHAFFKALLFLGAGSVIHGMSGEQDIRKMGGLRKHMPITWWTFLIGTLAIAGVPGLAGFFSKDEILWHTFATGHQALWLVGVITAGLTAFYMFRLLFLIFFGALRASHEVAHHVHESPPSMTVPLVVLALLSIVGGWVGLPEWAGGSAFARFLEPVTGHPHLEVHDVTLEVVLMLVSTAVAIGGIAVAYVFYVRDPALPARVAERFAPAYQLLAGKYWIDELYDAVIVRPYVRLSNVLWRVVDQIIIDGAVNGTATTVLVNGQLWRLMQTGDVQQYAVVFLGGALALLSYYLLR